MYTYELLSFFVLIFLKVPPAKVDFTLPSPALGEAMSRPPDCPWDACLLLDKLQGKKKDAKKIRDSGNELKKKQERCEYLMRALPISMEATVGVNVTEDDKGELRAGFMKGTISEVFTQLSSLPNAFLFVLLLDTQICISLSYYFLNHEVMHFHDTFAQHLHLYIYIVLIREDKRHHFMAR